MTFSALAGITAKACSSLTNIRNLWRGHDHPYHFDGLHTHEPEELPPIGTMHTHMHHHWLDHSHEHPHYHEQPHSPEMLS